MSIEELLRDLEWLKVETGSLACLGCEREDNCGMHGCRILREAIASISIMEQKERRWIPVKDSLPKCGERVLATDGVFVGEFYINKRGQWQRYNVNDYTLVMALDILRWMPLPAPPKEDAT